ncbi:MAG TPA: hypothetical protein VHR45_23940 [Thermoanaerobaculia bacterium]|nr:hypothetical protein [Thermoanaerobaculia bacterium]
MKEPTKELLKLVASRGLAHGNPIPALDGLEPGAASGPSGEREARENKSKDRIDGIVAQRRRFVTGQGSGHETTGERWPPSSALVSPRSQSRW